MTGVHELPTRCRAIELKSVNSVDVETRDGSLHCSIRSVHEELAPSLVARSRVLANLLESEGHVTLPLQAAAFLQWALLVMEGRPAATVDEGAGQSCEGRLTNGDLAAVIQVRFPVPGLRPPPTWVLPLATSFSHVDLCGDPCSDRPARWASSTKAVQCEGRSQPV
jgi:hypothetical protein